MTPLLPTSGHQLDMWVANTLSELDQATEPYMVWRAAYPVEARHLDQWLSNRSGPPPSFSSPWGRFLIGTAAAINRGG